MASGALIAGGRAFALPEGAQAVPRTVLRPAPLAAPGLLGIAMLDRQAAPVLAAAAGLPGGEAWVALDGPQGRVVVAGEALLDHAPPQAPHLVLATVAALAPPPPMAAGGSRAAGPTREARGGLRLLALESGGVRFVLPMAAVERVDAPCAVDPAPWAGPGALGYGIVGGAGVLVLDPAWFGAAGGGAAAALLVLFHHRGRRFGLPAERVGPGSAADLAVAPRLDSAPALLAAAPQASDAVPAPPVPTRLLLLCMAGDRAFALPVEEVVAVIAPQRPAPAPAASGMAGLVAHRGEVLPVLDAGRRLALGPVLADARAEAPMLRLVGPRPVALAVSRVAGLRAVERRLVSDVPGDGPIAAIAALDGPLPVCRAAALGAVP
jgi:chemotaxis signal transduction protein